MTKGRLEAFSDGVLAIIITIMVLELRPPNEADVATLRPLIPLVLSWGNRLVEEEARAGVEHLCPPKTRRRLLQV